MQNTEPNKVHETLQKHMLADGFPYVYDIQASNGDMMRDARTGEDYFDFFSFFASQPVGHNHPMLQDKGYLERLMNAARVKPSNSDVYTTEMAAFIDTFAQKLTSPWFKHHFFIEGGGLAIENAMKVAFDWKVRKLGKQNEADVNDLTILHFKEAFHGRTGYTLSVTNTSDPRKFQFFPKFPWPRVTNPKCRFPQNEENLAAVKKLEEQALKEIDGFLASKNNNVAAILIEPIQGEGGDNHFRKEFMQALKEKAEQGDALLIFDEVQTGFGLTGTTWCFEQLCVVPDIVCFGKKTQVCGIACGPRIDEVKDNVFQVSSRINSTWGGGLVDMVRCHRYIEIFEKENLRENAAQQGEFFLGKLREVEERFPKVISNARGKGLMCAFDLPDGKSRDSFLEKMMENKLIALSCGDVSVRFRPFLDVKKDSIEKACGILGDVAKHFA